ncbi:MAG: hypothetical protein R3F11_02865 [Verrucomicrobiales bacterium]
MPADTGIVAGALDRAAPRIDGGGVGVADDFAFGAEAFAGLGVDELEVAGFGEAGFDGVEDLEGEDVVPLGAELRESSDQIWVVVEEIGGEDDEAARSAEGRRFAQGGGDPAGAGGGLRLGEGGADGGEVGGAAAVGRAVETPPPASRQRAGASP